MMDSARKTAGGPIEFVFRTDDDAPLPDEFWRLPDTTIVTGPRATLSSLWNECLAEASADIFMQCDDEVVFHTSGWDTAVKAAFDEVPDKILFVHGDDLHQPAGTFGTLGFLHRRWTETVGYFTPPYFSCDYGDTWLNDVANMLDRRRFLPGIITEHVHPAAGKAAWDATHQDRVARGARDNTPGLYAAYASQRVADAEKLRGLLGTPA